MALCKVFIFEKCNTSVVWNVLVTLISFSSLLEVTTKGKKKTNMETTGDAELD